LHVAVHQSSVASELIAVQAIGVAAAVGVAVEVAPPLPLHEQKSDGQ
jgi:hypothetical protein